MSKQLPNSTIDGIYNWFKAAVPTPQPKNIHTQIGCDLEEMVELLETLTVDYNDPHRATNAQAIALAREALHTVSEGLKKGNILLELNMSVRAKEQLLDAICDRAVTGIGVAYMLNMNPTGALEEVNRSNWSKFDDNGNPIFDPNQKIIKGPNYKKANMLPYLTPPADTVIGADVVDTDSENPDIESTDDII